MSNLRKTKSLLILTSHVTVVALLTMTGCSTLPGSRLGALEPNPNVKTRLAIGDKALPAVTGEPGASVADDEPAASTSPRRRSNADNRVSGRVYDENGEPVDGATVRLAVNGSPGGRVTRVTTDPSGGFTLRGLRPDTPYTLIAEWDGAEGPMSGRIVARSSDTELKITLAPLDSRSDEGSRVNRVSEHSEIDAEDRGDTSNHRSGRPIVNEEDLPPALEAEAVEAPWPGKSNSKNRWETGPKKENGPASADSNPGKIEEPSTPIAEDDGPNPLPPAIEPASESNPKTEPLSTRDSAVGQEIQVSQRDPEDPLPPAVSQPRRPRRPKKEDMEVAKQDEDTIPGALVVVPETFAPVVIQDSKIEPADGPTEQAKVSRKTTAARPRTETAPLLTKPTPRSKTKQKPTWGEVTSATPDLPPLEGEEAREEVPRQPVKHFEADDQAPDWTKPPAEAEPIQEAAIEPNNVNSEHPKIGTRPAKLKDDAAVLCDYDERHRRINDFRLPDLQGRPVRFKDLDADLILLDFWGTWCQPCLKSIPKLVDLQAKYPGKKLLVVGVACEQGEFKESSAKVAATAAKLKINYPILMSRNDGSCPLQGAMHIQAFPTLVLVDREGRVVWRDQGATPATITRLERLVLEAGARETASRSAPSRL